ncbi:hypothetical protein [Rhodococcus sp. ZPP]|uniref:hypothetical protein n=1 Tax=Rhodococcus sp. ZPP TaxID=2749906 RepID=UPI001FCA52E3|nr:hypothetical protein [Rhodococcus sp. ZPP]
MPNQSGHSQSLRQVPDCATAMRRWLATDDNSAALMAHLRAEPVDAPWLSIYRRLYQDLIRSVGNAYRNDAPEPVHPPGTPNEEPLGAFVRAEAARAARPRGNCCAPVPEMTDEQRVGLERVRDARGAAQLPAPPTH